ncbi:MAG: hypothetical protein KA383_15425 [Phycisphaerae bacterium]|nr:hypothetical protein [Phycisphaerae bacterium]
MIRIALLSIAATLVLAFSGAVAAAQEKQPAPTTQPAKADEGTPKTGDTKLVPLEIKLPRPAFKGTPTNIPPGTNLEPPRKGPRPPFLAPPGTKNVALNKPVTSSDREPIIGTMKLVTDGDNEAKEGSYVELGPGLQWVQIDLKEKYNIYAILVWHYHSSARVYHDVVVQVADDADFIENVRTLYSNDHDNSSGLGLGTEKEFWETYEGRLIDAKGATARYVRLYSKGSTADDQNHYIEVEVYGLPAK